MGFGKERLHPSALVSCPPWQIATFRLTDETQERLFQRGSTTHLENLFLCGTDQGFLGIIGSMLSGITIANLHLLKGT